MTAILSKAVGETWFRLLDRGITLLVFLKAVRVRRADECVVEGSGLESFDGEASVAQRVVGPAPPAPSRRSAIDTQPGNAVLRDEAPLPVNRTAFSNGELAIALLCLYPPASLLRRRMGACVLSASDVEVHRDPCSRLTSIPVNNPQRLLLALDEGLDHEAVLVLYGRATLVLGYDGAPELHEAFARACRQCGRCCPAEARDAWRVRGHGAWIGGKK